MDGASNDQTLFVIPDIGGFTKFVTQTEVSHSQHIIKELLEILVDANTMGLKVSEFEGDAVLFYRAGPPPSAQDLVEQAKKMFVDFHTHLKQYEFLRICPCGACSSASRLALKIIVHFGSAGTMQVKDHVKFIGKDIIVAHRLLKNSVKERDYLLITRQSLAADLEAGSEASSFVPGADTYDELGTIEYQYLSLAGYRDEIRVERPARIVLKNPHKVMEISLGINAPLALVYQHLIDLPGRMQWIEGIRKVELHDEGPNQIGTRHKCVRQGGDPEVITSDVRIEEEKMELWETDVRKMVAVRYLLETNAGGATDARVEAFVRGHIVLRIVFKLLLEKKLKDGFEKSLRNLARLCESSAQ